MNLYLVQHAEAKSEQQDPQRPLSEEGMDNLKKTGNAIKGLNIHVEEIWHSTKLRAKQTAAMISEYIKSDKGCIQKEGLSPLDDPTPIAEQIKSFKEDLMIVGHLPFLSRLTSLLICGNQETEMIEFRMGGVLCLIRRDDEQWRFKWYALPEMGRVK
jgi:phosphohistidine phosphatase